MAKPVKRIILKIAKWSAITIASLLLILFLAPIVFPGTVAEQIKTFANKKIDGELQFSKARLSFFNHFPSLTVTLYDLSLKGSAPFKNDTLLSANEVAFGINLKRLIFDNDIRIDKIFISESFVNVLVDENGKANYNVYVSDAAETSDTISKTSVKLEKIDISNCHLRYEDRSVKMLVEAKGFNYLGKGDLSQAVFDLETDAEIDSLDFFYNNEPYLQHKNIQANLITRVNTNSLAIVFHKNDLMINKLPVDFNGELKILKEGYDIDVTASSMDSNLRDLFTALPPEYVKWLDKTNVKGKTDLKFSFKGNYNSDKKTNPDLAFEMNVRGGYIESDKTPFPTSDIFLQFKTELPSMDLNRLSVKINPLSFKVGTDYLKANVETAGLEKPSIKADIKGTLDLQKLDESLGLSAIDMKGLLNIDVVSNGTYDPVTHKFPETKAKVLLRNGMLKTPYYPNPITNINVDLNALNDTGNFRSTVIAINPAGFIFEGNPFSLNAKFANFDDVSYDVRAKGTIDIGRIYKVFSQKGLDVSGLIKANLALKGVQSYATSGQYGKLDNSGTLYLQNIKATSELFPKPFLINEGLFSFKQEKTKFDKFIAHYGESDFAMNGYLNNVINYFFESRGTLSGAFNVNSDYININEFMALKADENEGKKPQAEAKKTANTQQSGVVLLPSNLNVSLTANAKKVAYDKLNLEKLKGTVGIKDGRLTLKQTGFELIGCRVLLDAIYDDVSVMRAGFDAHLQARNFDVKRAYKEIELFRNLVTAAEKAEGIISIDYKLNGTLDGNMMPIYPSLIGRGTVTLSKVKIQGLKMFSIISDKTGSDGIDNPDLSRVDIKTSIKDNIIYVEKTRMGLALFRLRFEGKTSFDGQLNLKMRLGLPPFGVIGIPFTITGTQDDPKIKIFSKKTEETEGTDYDGKMIIKNKALQEDLKDKSGENPASRTQSDTIKKPK